MYLFLVPPRVVARKEGEVQARAGEKAELECVAHGELVIIIMVVIMIMIMMIIMLIIMMVKMMMVVVLLDVDSGYGNDDDAEVLVTKILDCQRKLKIILFCGQPMVMMMMTMTMMVVVVMMMMLLKMIKIVMMIRQLTCNGPPQITLK